MIQKDKEAEEIYIIIIIIIIINNITIINIISSSSSSTPFHHYHNHLYNHHHHRYHHHHKPIITIIFLCWKNEQKDLKCITYESKLTTDLFRWRWRCQYEIIRLSRINCMTWFSLWNVPHNRIGTIQPKNIVDNAHLAETSTVKLHARFSISCCWSFLISCCWSFFIWILFWRACHQWWWWGCLLACLLASCHRCY